MENKYIITDIRTNNDFKKCSFSGYKKTDLLTEFQKSIENRKLENALFWLTEIHCSQYLEDFFEKVFLLISKNIHLNSYQLPIIIYNHYLFWINSDKNVNNLKIRNCLFEIVTLLVQCDTGRVLQKKKIIKDTEFNMNKLSGMITCSTNHISPNIIKQKDPKILTIVINELSYCIIRHQDMLGNIQDKKTQPREHYMEKAIYWISWIHKWETVQKKKGGSLDCDNRDVTNISKEESCDIIWIVWAVILAECQRRIQDPCIAQVASLFNMYKYKFSRNKKNTKIPILIHTLALLILDNATISKTELSNPLTIQAIMKCNQMYSMKKKFEIKKKHQEDLFVIRPRVSINTGKTEEKRKKKKEKLSEITLESLRKFDLVLEINKDILAKKEQKTEDYSFI